MRQVVRASTQGGVQADSADRDTLAPQMVEAAVLRLRWISLTCAAITGLATYLEGRLQPEIGELLKDPIHKLVLLFTVLTAIGINAVARYRLLSPLAILNLGLGFELVVAAAIKLRRRWADR